MTCSRCDSRILECTFCKSLARHFIEGKTIKKAVYFCDNHVELMPKSLRDGEFDEQLAAWTDDSNLELGKYAPGPDGCDCDSWT